MSCLRVLQACGSPEGGTRACLGEHPGGFWGRLGTSLWLSLVRVAAGRSLLWEGSAAAAARCLPGDGPGGACWRTFRGRSGWRWAPLPSRRLAQGDSDLLCSPQAELNSQPASQPGGQRLLCPSRHKGPSAEDVSHHSQESLFNPQSSFGFLKHKRHGCLLE